MFDIQTMMPVTKAPTSAGGKEKVARELSGQFLELMLKPMFSSEQGEKFGGDSWMGDSAVSSNLIQPAMVQHMASVLAHQGNAFGLYPIFLKAVEQVEGRKMAGVSV